MFDLESWSSGQTRPKTEDDWVLTSCTQYQLDEGLNDMCANEVYLSLTHLGHEHIGDPYALAPLICVFSLAISDSAASRFVSVVVSLYRIDNDNQELLLHAMTGRGDRITVIAIQEIPATATRPAVPARMRKVCAQLFFCLRFFCHWTLIVVVCNSVVVICEW